MDSHAQIQAHHTRIKPEWSAKRIEDGKQMDGILRGPRFQCQPFVMKSTGGMERRQRPRSRRQNPLETLRDRSFPRWIDRTAKALGIKGSDYITQTYAPMFFAWKRKTGSSAKEMTFRAVKGKNI